MPTMNKRIGANEHLPKKSIVNVAASVVDVTESSMIAVELSSGYWIRDSPSLQRSSLGRSSHSDASTGLSSVDLRVEQSYLMVHYNVCCILASVSDDIR